MGKVPFRTVYLTSIVTDENGDKMSKTKGNVIDPLDVVHGATLDELIARADAANTAEPVMKAIRKNFGKGIPPMGADALRFALAALNTAGRIRLSVDRVEGYRNFINKLWNASRFALMNLEGYEPEKYDALMARGGATPGLAEKWIMSRLQHAVSEVDEALEAFRFSDAAQAIYHFVWHELCDWYIEMAKPNLHIPAGGSLDPIAAMRRLVSQGVLSTALETCLRLLHPFAPFVTEEIWQKLPHAKTAPASVMVTIFPKADRRWIDDDAEKQMKLLQDVTVAIRMLRSTYNVPPSWSVPVEVRVPDAAKREVLNRHRAIVENAGRVTMTITEGGVHVPQSAKAIVGADAEVVMVLAGLVDIEAEKARITKEIAKVGKEIDGIEKKLGNEAFVAKAPEDVVAEVRQRLVDEQTRKTRLEEALAALGA